MKEGITLSNSYDLFRIELNNIDKAVLNDEMAKLFLRYYPFLYLNLVRTELDKDIFNDTYLKLTYNYNPEKDFYDLFEYYFKMLKGWYYRSSKVIKYHITELDENTDIEDEEAPDLNCNDNFEELRNAVLSKAK